MPDQPAPPASSSNDPSIFGGLRPDELFARGMQSVKMTGAGGLGNWEPPTVQEATRLFPNYEILDIIGRGGMGAVYKARQTALDRIVAIKLLPLEVSMDRDFAERFKREARTMGRLNHANIVSVFDFGTTTEGHLYFVMEFVEGTTLHHLIKTTGLKPQQALEIIMGVCEALNYAHAEGVVHRDIKPANVLVDVRGRVKVTDFGLARLSGPSAAEQAGYTVTGTVLGTPDYMAPEQKRGMHVDHRADIYSLGVMLYEMLCGNVPQGVFDLPSRLVSVDERVDQVVVRAMQQEPDRRYQNTAEMKHEVQTIRVARDPNAMAPQPRGAAGSPAKSKTPIAAIAAVLLAAAGIGFWKFREKDPGDADPSGMAKAKPGEKVGTAAGGKTAEPTPEPEKEPAKDPVIAATPAPTPEPPKAAPTPEPKPVVAAPPPVTPSVPAIPAATPPVTTSLPPIPAVAIRPVENPDMASAVAQLGPNPNPTNSTNSLPAPAIVDWQRFASQAEIHIKKRDPDAAIAAYDQAISAAESADPPVAVVEIARLCQKMGSLEAAIGSVAEARGSFEHGKRLLQDARAGGKLPPEALQVLAEIEGGLRRLPRDDE